MVNVLPEVIKSARYTQSDTARLLGVNRHTVANYEKRGLLAFRVRKPDMRKVTTGADIIRFWERMLK